MLCESWSSASNNSTMSHNPFLQLSGNPKWENLKPHNIRKDITLALEKAEINLQKIQELHPEKTTFANTVKALENASYELNYAWGLITHLDAVCNSPELQEAHNEMLPAVSALLLKLHSTLSFGRHYKPFLKVKKRFH